MAERESLLLRDLSEACRKGAKADIHRLCLALSRRGKGAKNRKFGHIYASVPSLKEFKEWLESPAATAKELLETYDELGVDDQNVRQDSKDEIHPAKFR